MTFYDDVPNSEVEKYWMGCIRDDREDAPLPAVRLLLPNVEAVQVQLMDSLPM